MAAYPLDSWKTILPLLDAWHDLTPAQRRVAATMESRYEPASREFATLDPALKKRLLETDSMGWMRPTPGLKRLQSFITRLGAWCDTGKVDVGRFVDLYTIYAQRYALTGARGLSQVAVSAAFAKSLADGAYTRRLLESKSLAHFLEAVGGWVPDGIEFTEARYRILKGWLKNILAQPGPAFLLRPQIFPPAASGVDPEDILHLALAYGAVVVGRMPDTLAPYVWVLAPREKNIQDPARIAYASLDTRESWTRPFLLEDMEAYLRALKADPAPLLSDAASVPVAHHRKVARTFGALPYAPGPEGFGEESRARTAWWMLGALRLIEASGKGRKTWRAHPGARSAAWLAATRESRLEDLLALAPCGTRKRHPIHHRFSFLGDFEANPFPYSALSDLLFEWIDAFFARLEKPSDWNRSVASAIANANPFLAEIEDDAELIGAWARWQASPQDTYASLLHQYAGRLASLGALSFHRDKQGNLGVSLSEAGRFLYGLQDRWKLTSSARPVAVVGGDFAVTLLEPAPDFLLELRAFAEPAIAGGTGSAWRISRRTVQEAAHKGLSGEGILKTLRAWSKHALPANVVHEIEAWAGARRGVRLSEAVLLEGEDPLAMAEILSAFPKDFERLSPTVLKAKPGTKRAAMIKKLAKKGFFAE